MKMALIMTTKVPSPSPTLIIRGLRPIPFTGYRLSAELNHGQMVEDVRLAVNGLAPVEHFGRSGGAVFSPDEVYQALLTKIINRK